MVNTGWIIASAGTAVLIAVVAIQRMLRGKRSGFQKERAKSQEVMTLGS